MLRVGARAFRVLVYCLATVAAGRAATFAELAAQADAAREADQVPQAIHLYQQALQMKPAWSQGWFYLGTLFYDSDRYSAAQRAFGRYVRLVDKPAGWAFLGLCEFETGAYGEARGHLQRGVDGGLAPEIGQVVRFHQALLLTRLGLFDQALPWYRPLVRRGIHEPALTEGLGLNALGRAMLPKEIPPGERALAGAAGQAAYTWLAGDQTAAAPAVRALVAAYPDAPGVHGFCAAVLLESDPDAAMAELRRELEVNPQNVEARAMLALLLVRAGKKAEAAPLARSAMDARPSSPLAQFALAQTLDDVHQAAAHLEIAAKLDPSNFEYHMALARVYSKIGRYDQARRERKISIEMARASDPHGR